MITTADPNPPSDTQVPLPPPAFAAADVEITGNLIANNDLTGFGAAVTVAYSDVFGHPDGEYSTRVPDRTGVNGNISEDPLLDGAGIPAECSPTIDAADPGLDFSAEPAPDGGRANMGHTGGTTAATPSLPDLNGDGVVDGIDMLRLSVSFGSTSADARYNSSVDVNGDGSVDGDDLALVAPDYGMSCD